ncbi:MAG: polysaccharide biosynthesis protein [Candidatus Promineifilaceae bacterium]|nr:polysaccharide biosynthesis protein [Candidatus Promineifilaceae bacterium]
MILGHGENSIFDIYHELKQVPDVATVLNPVIADIRFPERLQAVFEEYQPEIVFHAAAHKHVPLMELNPAEAITNNVLGTHHLLNVALAHDVQRFVLISTDKAVNPTSVMGASKRAAELLVYKAAHKSKRPYVTVRFGNVLGSRGSVVLTFEKQIADGGPITVTHPEMCRFFMTIPEAVQLVLQAAVLGSGNEVFVLDMGDPVRIYDLAKDMIILSGLQVGRDIDITFTGKRPGEKLFEELFTQSETYVRSPHEKIFIAADAIPGLPPSFEEGLRALEEATERNDKHTIKALLQRLVPEYQPPDVDGSIHRYGEVEGPPRESSLAAS